MDRIIIQGVHFHNLKNIDVDISKGSFTVITGVSGWGKSSLAFDLLFEDGAFLHGKSQFEGLLPFATRQMERATRSWLAGELRMCSTSPLYSL